MSLSELISNATQRPVQQLQQRRIASLWAGWGAASALTVSLEPVNQPGDTLHLVAKQVTPPRAAATESHLRKVRSYEVECAFYSSSGAAAHVLQRAACLAPLPKPLLVRSQPPDSFLLLLCDLSQEFPVTVRRGMNTQQLQVALTWLASFHACFWGQRPASGPASSTAPGDCPPGWLQGLWPQGSYWHLATRQEELQAMGEDWEWLHDMASQVDGLLRGFSGPAPPREEGLATDCAHATLLHGDFKAANLVFSAEGGRCAAYDFQYTGWGVGMVDVAYLLCSSGDEQQVAAHEEALLRHYHTTLMSRLGELQPGPVAEAAQRTYTWEVLRQHYDLALLDFVRFMAGWGSWGAVGYAHNAARQAARRLGLLRDDPGRAR